MQTATPLLPTMEIMKKKSNKYDPSILNAKERIIQKGVFYDTCVILKNDEEIL